MLTPENQRWIDDFCAKNARPPRVLHIGNIANNAYNNAKLLNDAGLDNDVICYDYYHIMGCPEWEDADLDGDVSDDFHPNWNALNLNGFERPRWFAQGTLDHSIRYLTAKRSGKNCRALWRQLGIDNLTLVAELTPQNYKRIQLLISKVYQFAAFPPIDAFAAIYSKANTILGEHFGCTLASTVMFFWSLLKSTLRLSRILKNMLRRCVSTDDNIGYETQTLIPKLLNEWQSNFPDRQDMLTQEDIQPYVYAIEEWKRLFRFYDIVIGYSTDPFIPLLAGVPYFAIEHGTIRQIPFNNDPQGRRAAISYRLAKHVFVTNFDCLKSAEQLSPGKFTSINHPFDEDHGIGIKGFQELRLNLRIKLKSEFLFFFPTRQDWVEATGYADKANDVFFHALAELRKNGYRAGAVCCSWGANVLQSKELIEKYQLNDYILWVKPMAMVKFERMSLACEIVVDQFKIGAFGGVVFKALAVGAPVMTYLDKNRLLKQYSQMPPVINCQTSSEIVSNIVPFINSPEKLQEIGKKSMQWMKLNHSKVSTANHQVDQFRHQLLLNRQTGYGEETI